ncbi:MAG: hypothetical protein ACPKM0_05190 [Pleomorphochaeta sp.]
MKKLLLFLLMIVDILIFIFLFITQDYLLIILILHVVIYTISWKLNKKIDNNKHELPFYIILFMPIIGPFIYFLFYFSLNYFFSDNELIMDYEKMIDAKLENISKNRIEYEKEIKTMSFIDMLSYMDPDRKKEVLIDSQYSVRINNANILKKGLESDDKEVQHYSATLLNSKENELTNNISYLREKYNNSKNEVYLDQLINSYKVYINSTLIEEDSINIFRQEYIDVLNIKLKNNTYTLEILSELFKTYIQIIDLNNAELINEKIIKEYGESEQTQINTLNILYKKGEFNLLKDKLIKIDDKLLNNSDKLIELRDFFIEENE